MPKFKILTENQEDTEITSEDMKIENGYLIFSGNPTVNKIKEKNLDKVMLSTSKAPIIMIYK